MSTPTGPYRVEREQTAHGPRWRLAGPGLTDVKSYEWEEAREKLREMAELMNFAWRQAQSASAANTSDEAGEI